jgi:hypothetical protein
VIVVDILLIVFVAALLLAGGPIVVKKLLRMDPKRKELEAAQALDERGETNTVKFNLAQLRNCALCHKPTDPIKDLRTQASWIHSDCYLNSVNDKDKGHA